MESVEKNRTIDWPERRFSQTFWQVLSALLYVQQ